MDLPHTESRDRLLGTVVGGRYELLAKIGSGGMGSVYRARSENHGGLVAVKVLRPDLGDSPSAIKRFRAEARHGAALAHPHTVRVLDFGADGDLLYLVMELIDGRSLAAVLRDEGRLPWRRAVRIAIQVLKSLREAHEQQIVHRDIKPSNILLRDLPGDPDDVKVVDLGISRSLEASGAGTLDAIGTPAYIAPEQWRAGDIDARTDLYSLGCVLFEMLAGRPPFVASRFEGYFQQHVEARPPEPRGLMPDDVPQDLAELVLELLAKRPGQRPASAAEVIGSLERVRSAPTIGDVEPDDEPVLRPPGRYRRSLFAVATLLTAGAGLALVVALVLPSPAPRTGVLAAGSATAGAPAAPLTDVTPFCILAASQDPAAPDAPADSRAAALADALRQAGLVVTCTGRYQRHEDRHLHAVKFGMIQNDGRASAAQVEALRKAVQTRFPDVAVRPDLPGPLLAPIELLMPDEPEVVAATPAPARTRVCVLGPSTDLAMMGPWRQTTTVAAEVLGQQGFVVDCVLPYVRRAARFGAAARQGLVQHDGSDPATLTRLLTVLRATYPDVRAEKVEAWRLFRKFDVLVPDGFR